MSNANELGWENPARPVCPDSSWALCAACVPPKYGARTLLEWESHDLLSGKIGHRSFLWPAIRQKGGWEDIRVYFYTLAHLREEKF